MFDFVFNIETRESIYLLWKKVLSCLDNPISKGKFRLLLNKKTWNKNSVWINCIICHCITLNLEYKLWSVYVWDMCAHTHNTEMYLNFILKMSFLQYENNLLKLFIVPCNSQLQKHWTFWCLFALQKWFSLTPHKQLLIKVD